MGSQRSSRIPPIHSAGDTKRVRSSGGDAERPWTLRKNHEVERVQRLVDNSSRGRRVEVVQRLVDGARLRNENDDAVEARVRGLPTRLRSGIESLSGVSMRDVLVHRNSGKPAGVGALAYTQGRQIFLGPGQDRHLPHEAWHVVQQAQGRVSPTNQVNGVDVNDDASLEREADLMSERALQLRAGARSTAAPPLEPEPTGPPALERVPVQLKESRSGVVQRRMGVEAELTVPVTGDEGQTGTAEGRVRSFLGLGVGYNEEFQATANGFHIDTDKDPIAATVRSVRDNVNLALVAVNAEIRNRRTLGGKVMSGLAGLVGVSWDQHALVPRDRGPVANMEYVSDPFDEETNNGRVALQAAIAAMAADIRQKRAGGRVGLQRQGEYNYGVPAAADWQAFANATGLNLADLLAWRQRILNDMRDTLYVQITAGILPAGIATLQQEAAADRDVTGQVDTLNVGQSAEDNVKVRQLVTARSATIAHKVVTSLAARNGIKPLHDIRGEGRLLDSLRGYLGLVVSYVLGHAVVKRRVGTVHKNIVPFFSKLPLNELQRALDVRVRPDQWTAADRTSLARAITDEIGAELNRVQGTIRRQDFYGAIPVDTNELAAQVRGWLPHVLDGSRDQFSEAQLEACTRIEPEVHAKSRDIYAPSEGGSPGHVQLAHELAMALEYRMIREDLDITADGLWPFVQRVMAQIRRANAG